MYSIYRVGALKMELKLQRFTKVYPLKTCNFKKQCIPNLIYDEVIVNGLITKELYYADEEKTELVVEVDVSYIYGEDTLVEKMYFDISYYTDPHKINNPVEGGPTYTESVVGMTQRKVKVLTKRQRISLLKKRRKTIRETAEADTLGLLKLSLVDKSVPEILQIGAAWLIAHDTALDHYEKVGSPQILADIQAATDSWLDAAPLPLGGATIRQYLLGSFSS